LTSFALLFFSYDLPVITVESQKVLVRYGQTVRNNVQRRNITTAYHPGAVYISEHTIQIANAAARISKHPAPSIPALYQHPKCLLPELYQDAQPTHHAIGTLLLACF
jgi:hypothetical protein